MKHDHSANMLLAWPAVWGWPLSPVRHNRPDPDPLRWAAIFIRRFKFFQRSVDAQSDFSVPERANCFGQGFPHQVDCWT